jgi:signal peptidase II
VQNSGISTEKPAMKAVPPSRFLMFAAIAVLGATVDLATKRWIFEYLGMPYERPSLWLFDEVFGFTTSLNEGALFGMGQGLGFLYSGLSIVAALGIVGWLFLAGAATDRLLTVALAAVTAGILGNLYDRLGLPGLTRNGEPVFAVRDWLHFKIDPVLDWPIFNIADSLLVCGAALLVWHALRTAPPSAVAAESKGS